MGDSRQIFHKSPEYESSVNRPVDAVLKHADTDGANAPKKEFKNETQHFKPRKAVADAQGPSRYYRDLILRFRTTYI